MKSSRVRFLGVPLLIVLILLGSSGGAGAEDSIIRGVLRFLGINREPAPPAVQEAQEAPGGDPLVNQFTPHLKKLATAEIHFLRKVCRPDEAQLAELRRVADEEVHALSRAFAEDQQNRRRASDWPDPRKHFTDSFQRTLEEVMPDEAAKRYRQELTAREQFQREAAREMMTVLIDRQLSLSPEQYERVGRELDRNWTEEWSRSLQIFITYEQYAPMPDENLLRPLLNGRQQAIWNSRGRRGNVSFGWQRDLGLDLPWGGGADLEELDAYPEEGD